MTEYTFLALEEIKKSGLLQEINRQFLHPMGLALAVLSRQFETGAVKYIELQIIDAREGNPEGLVIDNVDGDHITRANNIVDEQKRIGKKRTERYGFVVQPIQGRVKQPELDTSQVEVSMS